MESGGIRTKFTKSANRVSLSPGYHNTSVQSIFDGIATTFGNEASDPAKGKLSQSRSYRRQLTIPLVAQRVVEAVDGTGITGAAIARSDIPMGYATRLPMGSDCGTLYGQYTKVILDTVKNMEEVCQSTDFEGEKSMFAAHV